MAARKQYADPAVYEEKLKKVMGRLGVELFDYDWSRFSCWVSFTYKGQAYRFEHGVENANAHGVRLSYGSDAFAQLVLALEDLARMVERGIYDLSTWISGLKYLPAASSVEPCFQALGFTQMPDSAEDIRMQYKKLAKVMHPDAGGNEKAFQQLTENYNQCLSHFEE